MPFANRVCFLPWQSRFIDTHEDIETVNKASKPIDKRNFFIKYTKIKGLNNIAVQESGLMNMSEENGIPSFLLYAKKEPNSVILFYRILGDISA